MENAVSFTKIGFGKRINSMLKVDLKRAFKSKLFYIIIATALLIPILMTVMMSMMDGSVSIDPQTGAETVMEGPENTWQNIGTLPGEPLGGDDIFMLCNINMAFIGVAVFICLFISEDFRSGYAKNIFTVRSQRGEYVVSKTVTGFICGAFMLLAYLIGSILGGAISSLSFDLHGLSAVNIVMCILSKIFLMLVFVAIDVIVSVSAKQRAWLCLCGSLGAGMLLFMMVSMITPLGSTIVNAALCLVGGLLFSFGLGAISNKILKKTSLV